MIYDLNQDMYAFIPVAVRQKSYSSLVVDFVFTIADRNAEEAMCYNLDGSYIGVIDRCDLQPFFVQKGEEVVHRISREKWKLLTLIKYKDSSMLDVVLCKEDPFKLNEDLEQRVGIHTFIKQYDLSK